jgi:hypothetical protein
MVPVFNQETPPELDPPETQCRLSSSNGSLQPFKGDTGKITVECIAIDERVAD